MHRCGPIMSPAGPVIVIMIHNDQIIGKLAPVSNRDLLQSGDTAIRIEKAFISHHQSPLLGPERQISPGNGLFTHRHPGLLSDS